LDCKVYVIGNIHFEKAIAPFGVLLFMLTGTVAGLYVGTEYGVERIRGTRDWVILSTPFVQLSIFFLQ